MSRAYRLRLRESLSHILKAQDSVSLRLEVLEILPADQTAQLLVAELQQRGFEGPPTALARETASGVKITIDAVSGTVTASVEECREVEASADMEVTVFEEDGAETRERIQQRAQNQLRRELDRQAEKHEQTHQTELTDRLEAELANLRKELDVVVNRVTTEALKRKAAQLGEIKQISEDADAGALTIVLEV